MIAKIFAQKCVNVVVRHKPRENIFLMSGQEREDLKKSLDHHDRSRREFVMKNCESICGLNFRQDQKNDDKIAKIGNAMFGEPSGSVVYTTKKQ
jgi:hypothetical protein